MGDIAAVIMHGAQGVSRGERIVERARQASAEDLVVRLRSAGVELVHLVSDDATWSDRVSQLGATPFAAETRTPFHVGQALQDVVRAAPARGMLYFGSGAGALLEENDLQSLLAFAAEPGPAVLLNNAFSADFAAIAGASYLLTTPLPQDDNGLGLALADGGWRCHALPRSAGTQFDIDTPTDVLLLAAAEAGGERLRAACVALDLETSRVAPLLDRLVDRSAHTYLVGRVHPRAWAQFEANVACRTSGLFEGRGLRGYPDRPGTVLGAILESGSSELLFQRLAGLCDAAILDTRPLLAREGRLPPPQDRFASDLLDPGEIPDPCWRGFTEAAISSGLPVLLGGHNLVSGGLYLLGEVCWRGRDLPRRLPAEPLRPPTFEATEESHERP